MSRIAVIGGGISGLAAAHRLMELDARANVSVFESSHRLGGALATEAVDGFRIESGPDSMLSQLPWGVELCRRIGFADELIGTNSEHRQTWVVRAGRLIPLPEGLAIMAPRRLWPTVRSPILSVRGKLRLACERFIRRRTDTTDESLADFATRRVGRETFERLVQPLVSGIYMADPRRLSIQAAMPRFAAMEAEHGSLIRAARRLARTNRKTSAEEKPSPIPSSMFVAPRTGMESLVTALAQRLPTGSIHRNSTVEELVQKQENGWQVRGQTARSRFDENFDAVILATPSNRSAQLLQRIDASLASELSDITHSGCIIVTLAFVRDDIAHPLNGHGFVVPHVEQRDIVACTFSSVKYAERAPEGQVLLRVFLGGAMRPDLMELDDDNAVIAVVLRELNQLIGLSGQPGLVRVHRWSNVMPQYHVGHLVRMSSIEASVAMISGLELAGNSYRGVGIPHCIHSGEQAAESILKAVGRTRQSDFESEN
ncbi:MAG: protoporphyrinogen oxidase [Planctomycetales bacterium]|nr:protoporphyrinogen oxidase [Planctomycetales bacterium]